jgi:hypothetical protein
LAFSVVSLIPSVAQPVFQEFIENVLKPDYRKGAWHYGGGRQRTEEEILEESLLLTSRVRAWAEQFKLVTYLQANPSLLTSTVISLANSIYEERAFDRMPILADALQDAGCDNEDILNHCRQPGEHTGGCWVVDLLLASREHC